MQFIEFITIVRQAIVVLMDVLGINLMPGTSTSNADEFAGHP